MNAAAGPHPVRSRYCESRTSELSPDEVLDAYDEALARGRGLDRRRAGRAIADVPQGVYFDDDGAVLSLLVFGPGRLSTAEDLAGLDQASTRGMTLVVLLAF